MSFSLEGYKHDNPSIATDPTELVSTSGARFWSRLRRVVSWDYLFARVDTASLASVRIALGLLVAIEALHRQALFYPSRGVLPFHFRYQFFHWVQESPELSAYLPFVLFVSGIAVAVGFLFRFLVLFA